MTLPTVLRKKFEKASIASSSTISAEQLTSTDDATITDDLTVGGDCTVTGDLAAAGGFRTVLGPFYVTTAADQTDAQLTWGAAATHEYVAIRAGSVMGLSAQLSAAITHAGAGTLDVEVAINGTPIVSGPTVAFTTGGAEVKGQDTAAKDASGHTFAAGDLITVVYTSNTITNTPTLNAYVEIEH